MDDVTYIATHPLTQRILGRTAELVEEARGLAEGTRERQELERRITTLQQYGLPKMTDADRWRLRPIQNEVGQIIAPAGHSLRERLKEKRRGRPDHHRIAIRAALEQKIRDPQTTWCTLAEKYGLEPWDLERQIRLLKSTLKHEGIRIPSTVECRHAEKRFERAPRRAEVKFSQPVIPKLPKPLL